MGPSWGRHDSRRTRQDLVRAQLAGSPGRCYGASKERPDPPWQDASPRRTRKYCRCADAQRACNNRDTCSSGYMPYMRAPVHVARAVKASRRWLGPRDLHLARLAISGQHPTGTATSASQARGPRCNIQEPSSPRRLILILPTLSHLCTFHARYHSHHINSCIRKHALPRLPPHPSRRRHV